MIEFTTSVDGIYEPGQRVSLESGVEDAYVNWRNVAVFVTPETVEQAKAMDEPPANKMLRKPQAKK